MIRKLTLIFLIIIISSCLKEKRNIELLNSDSKYIQKHASDPVNWNVWSEKVWKNAKKENKLILISIGYFACHWCHVMQNESFKNKETAEIMNKYFYNVKIDREQFPDVDAHFSNIQKKLTGWAGWPMHFILKPDKTVVWTGVYMKPKKWQEHLMFIAKQIEKNPDYIYTENNISPKNKNKVKEIDFNIINQLLFKQFDTINGGLIPTHYRRKYPMPYFLSYLLKEYKISQNKKIEKFLKLTADKMYQGGIFDQIEGGFFRFSMDEKWHIPHFEKMLYTNASMISFYSKMYKTFNDENYKICAIKTADFLFSKMSSETPLFVGSLDADQYSEGSYYVYSIKELKQAFENNHNTFFKYFNISDENVWRDTSYHLFCMEKESDFAKKNNILKEKFLQKLKITKQKLLKIRKTKQNPEKGTKLISSWNALLISSFIELYALTKDQKYIDRVQKMVLFFEKKYSEDQRIKHYYLENRVSNSKTFPEDNLYLAKALIELYKYSKNKKYIEFAQKLFIDFQNKTKEGKQFPENNTSLPSIIAVQNVVYQELNKYYKTN